MDDLGNALKWAAVGFVVGACAMAIFIGKGIDPRGLEYRQNHAELCPIVLAEASPADSLAVFQKHEGCFEFVQSESP